MTTNARLNIRGAAGAIAGPRSAAGHAPAFPAHAMPPLDGDTGADVCVIGASFVGLRTAYDLLRNGKTVVVIEASATLPEQPERDEDAHCARLNDLLTGAGTEDQPELDHAAPATSAELAREIVHLGGRIHGATRALDVSPEHNMQVVTTFEGAVVARVVVVATDEHALGSGAPRRRQQPAGHDSTPFHVLSTPAQDGALPLTPHPYDAHQ